MLRCCCSSNNKFLCSFPQSLSPQHCRVHAPVCVSQHSNVSRSHLPGSRKRASSFPFLCFPSTVLFHKLNGVGMKCRKHAKVRKTLSLQREDPLSMGRFLSCCVVPTAGSSRCSSSFLPTRLSKQANSLRSSLHCSFPSIETFYSLSYIFRVIPLLLLLFRQSHKFAQASFKLAASHLSPPNSYSNTM